MKLIKFKKQNGKVFYVQLSQIVSFQHTGRDYLLTSTDGLGYRVVLPESDSFKNEIEAFKKFEQFLESNVAYDCRAIVE